MDQCWLFVRAALCVDALALRRTRAGARAYITGDLDVDGDLADGLRRAWTMARSQPVAAVTARARMAAAVQAVRLGAIGLPRSAPASEARLSGRLHTRRRDRAVIAHHYDLSNEFYQLLLDDHMAYSAAYFTEQGQSLHDAQTAKLDMICRKLGLEKGMRLLDVGCGWGSLILYAAKYTGCVPPASRCPVSSATSSPPVSRSVASPEVSRFVCRITATSTVPQQLSMR